MVTYLAVSMNGATEILWKGMVAMLVVTVVLIAVMYIFKYADKKYFEAKKKKEKASDGDCLKKKEGFLYKIRNLRK